MEARIQYAKTSDGVSIAYSTFGEGPPIVIAPNLMASHVQIGWDMPGYHSFFDRLSQRLQLVRFDPRGLGMSQRDTVDFSMDACRRDIEVVAAALRLDRFAIYNHVIAGDGPVAFAAEQPERVSSMIWWIGQTVNALPERVRQVVALDPLMDKEWDLYTQAVARLVMGWDSPAASAFAAVMREGTTPESRRASIHALQHADRAWLERIAAPSLVCHLGGAQRATNRARYIASAVPGAHMLAIPGPQWNIDAIVYDNELLTTAIADFVEATYAHPGAPAKAPELQLSAMRAILWTDVEDHTALFQRFGDAKARDILREHERITRDALTANGGAEVKAMGDGFMAWFPSAQQAVDCAVALQRAFAMRNASAAEPLRVRAAINAGEPIAEDDDLFGTAVIAAARICREAKGGEIIASDVVRQLVAGKGFLFGERGAVALKGFEEPVRLYDVRWAE